MDKGLNRRKMIRFLAACLAVLVFITAALLFLLRDEDEKKPYVPPRADAEFAPIDWSGDVWSDQQYIDEYDRDVYYRDASSILHLLSDDDYERCGDEAAFIYEVLTCIREGDANGYNAALSEYYKSAVGTKASFTEQKLYDVRYEIDRYVDGGEAGILTSYYVYFRIKNNNGTFRDDVGSDELRRMTYYLRETDLGWEIYTITYQDFGVKNDEGVDIMEFLPYFWLGVVVVAAIVEAMTVGLVSVWFIPGALVSMILAFCSVPWQVQLIAFILLSALGIVLMRTVLKKRLHPFTAKTNVDAVIGERAVVTERVDNLSGCGQVKVGTQIWSARSMDPDIVFEVGEVVTVMAIEGVKLICK